MVLGAQEIDKLLETHTTVGCMPMTTIHCDEDGCENEIHANLDEQWARVVIEVHGLNMEIHFCPTCWSKIAVRRALVLGGEPKETQCTCNLSIPGEVLTVDGYDPDKCTRTTDPKCPVHGDEL